jgi:hypothetical protein
VALVVTFLVLVFGREVSRSAHQELSARQSENLSFATLATTLLTEENSFDTQLASLLTSGSSLSRVAFTVKMSVMTQQLSQWRDEARFLESPVLSPALNQTFAKDTLTRVSDYDTVLAYVAQALDLTGPTTTTAALTLGAAQLSLSATAASWGAQRHELASAPGGVTLLALTNVSGRLNVPQYVATLASATNLSPTRAIVIAAIQVQPAPFPAPALTLLLDPTSTMQVQVAVSNLREILQPVSLTMILTPATGTAQRVTDTQRLAPMTSFAFAAHTFNVFPGEKGTLTVTLNGVPNSSTLLHSRTYSVSVAPTGSG